MEAKGSLRMAKDDHRRWINLVGPVDRMPERVRERNKVRRSPPAKAEGE